MIHLYISLFKNLCLSFFEVAEYTSSNPQVKMWEHGEEEEEWFKAINKQIKTKQRKVICTSDCEVDEMES